MITVNCFNCTTSFYIHPYRFKLNKKFFCCFSCRKGKKIGSKKEPVFCLNCNLNTIQQRAGRDVRFCSSLCYGVFVKKAYILKKGYKRVLKLEHPRADSKGYVREHILVMEKKLKRFIQLGEVVHHIDGNKLNNSPDNLKLLKNQSEHMKFHRKRE